MPWRLLVFIAVFGILLAFIAFNLENKCDISFGFTVIPAVPVFITIFISFALGLFCTLPFVIRALKMRKFSGSKEKKQAAPAGLRSGEDSRPAKEDPATNNPGSALPKTAEGSNHGNI